MSNTTSEVFVGRLAGVSVFDPLGDSVGRVRDIVALVPLKGIARALGLVIEVPGKRRVFLPLTRVTDIQTGQIVSTGVVNMRRFEQRPAETLIIGELLDRQVVLADGEKVTVEDISITMPRAGDWVISELYVRKPAQRLGFKRGSAFLVKAQDVKGLGSTHSVQGAAALMATLEELKPADLADRLHDMPARRRIEVAAELDDNRLADALEELGDDDRVAIVSALPQDRAADILEEMQPDDATDLVRALPGPQAASLLALMEPDEARDVRRLMAYGENTAGGLMTPQPVILTPETTIATALAAVRRQDIAPALASMVFITRPPTDTPTGRFIGVVHIQHMLREPPHRAIGSIVDTDIEVLESSDKLGRITRLLATYNLTALPVLDVERHLLGAVSVDDVLDHLLPDDWREADQDVTDRSMDQDTDQNEGVIHA